MSTKSEREEAFLNSLGLSVIKGKTSIKYANGVLTEYGFLKDESFDESRKGMCHWMSNDMSMKAEYLDAFLDLVINSKYLSDGLLWGIALTTWPVISRQLYDIQLPTPIVFFTGEPATLKTSIARMFLTTGTYRNGLFKPHEISAYKTAAKFEKQTKEISASLILLDDLHEVFNPDAKEKMQGNIDEIGRNFFNYYNDCSLVITSEKNTNLKFIPSFSQRTVWVNFSSMINKETDEKERYFDYMDSNSENILKILTAYQIYLLRRINDEHITSEYIKQRRKTNRKQSKENNNNINRTNDYQVIFEFSMSEFYNFCKENKISDNKLELLFDTINTVKQRTLYKSEFNFYKMNHEEKIKHCLKFIGSKGSFLATKPKKGMICKNFELPNYNNKYSPYIENHCKYFDYEREYNDMWEMHPDYQNELYNNEKDESYKTSSYMNNKKNGCYYHCFEYTHKDHACKLSIENNKFCSNKEIIESYWPTSFYLDENLKIRAILIKDFKKIPFIFEYHPDEHFSLLIVSADSFIKAIRDLYDDECKKYNIESVYLTKSEILDTLRKSHIIGYKKNPHYNDGTAHSDKIYKFDFPNEKAYILKISDEIYEAINSNIEKMGANSREHEKEETVFKKFSKENEIKLHNLFYHFDEIQF